MRVFVTNQGLLRRTKYKKKIKIHQFTSSYYMNVEAAHLE